MKIRTAWLASVVLAAAAAASSAQPITSSVAALPAESGPLSGTAVVYSKSFLQERYMQVGKSVGYALFIPGVFQQAVWRATGEYEGKTAERQAANAFEALLGEFDVAALVSERLRSRIGEAGRFSFAWAGDAETAEALIALAGASGKPAGPGVERLVAESQQVLGAFKVSYGLGARVGKEQFGFKKTYRPFVRILGVVKRASTGEQLWHGAVIAWGAEGYKGRPEAKTTPRDELVASFKAVTEEAVTLLLRSLAGEPLAPMGDLVDETDEDARF